MYSFHVHAIATVLLLGWMFQSRCRAMTFRYPDPEKHEPLQPENERSIKNMKDTEMTTPDLQNKFLSEEEHARNHVLSSWLRDYLNSLNIDTDKIYNTDSFEHNPNEMITSVAPENLMSTYADLSSPIVYMMKTSSDISDNIALGDAKPQQQTLRDSSHLEKLTTFGMPSATFPTENPITSNANRITVMNSNDSVSTSNKEQKPTERGLPQHMPVDEDSIKFRIIGGRAATYSGTPLMYTV